MTAVRVRFHPEAAAELDAAIRWYAERDAELGEFLLAEVRLALEKIAALPTAWPVSSYDDRVQYFALSRFPYRVLFSLDPEGLVVVAFAHRRRRPGYWRQR